MDKSIRKITADNSDLLQAVLGTFDENVNLIMQEVGVTVRVDAVKIVVSGAEDRVNLAAEVISSLLDLARKGETVDKGRVVYCIELAKEGKAGDVLKLSSGAVAVTFRGKPIKCKTVGQKTYVDSIKKDSVTFGIGPAGTGKTYLAVCLAVRSKRAKNSAFCRAICRRRSTLTCALCTTRWKKCSARKLTLNLWSAGR